jgi:hypothetical protein
MEPLHYPIDILAHHTDGGGVSDHVFAAMYLLGVKFQPRMSSPNDRRLYAFEAKGRYGALTRLRTFATVAASHLPPRAVAMPRPLRAAAICLSDFAPAA